MPMKDDKLPKVTQDAKRLRAKSKNRTAASSDNSGSAGSPQVNVEGERTPKKMRHAETAHEEPSSLGPDRGFLLPPCFKNGARRGGTISADVLKKAEFDKKVAEDEVAKLRAFWEKTKNNIEDLLKQKDEEMEAEKKKFANPELSWAPSVEESSDVAALKSRAEFVEKIDNLKLDLVDIAEAGFDRAVQQLRLLNPGLKTDNIGLSTKIVAGQLVPDSSAEDE
ncbi:uncharacterized protein LOC131641558 [Vicia villosa]|uniref:uncharacterized protein LOC131641558 n=1 Tax=Vicia villosa TaxID=3911 RepID=UPI00273B21BC|nr:uncharacterized protein LOC131641558 [Vicia villosa]